MRPRLVVVGGGRMGTALVGGLVAAGWDPGALTVVDADAARRSDLAEILPGVTVTTTPVASDGAVVAVKPADAETACRSLAVAGTARVLSIMAGVRLARLESWLGPRAAVVRAMPNTPALVGAGVSALAGGRRAGEADVGWAEEILGAVGTVVRLPEASLDAATGLSGSGPAYVFLVVEALIDAGVARRAGPRGEPDPGLGDDRRGGPDAARDGRRASDPARPGDVPRGHDRGRGGPARGRRAAQGVRGGRCRRHGAVAGFERRLTRVVRPPAALTKRPGQRRGDVERGPASRDCPTSIVRPLSNIHPQ